MALKGNLRDFSFAQLLNLISIARKTGTLVVENSSDQAWVTFREGKLAYARLGQEDGSLASVLYKTKKINSNQFQLIRQRATNMGDKELGLLLINNNYLSQQDILASLQMYFTAVVKRLFSWADGLFRFENNLLPPEDKITVRVSLENLIIEGARRLKETERLEQEIPSLDMALKFSERPDINIRNVNLSVDEWRVVSYVNPKNSIRQIAATTKKSDLEIRRIVYSLLQAGLVELCRPQGRPLPGISTQVPLPQESKEARKSLINRLIDRIRKI